MQKFKGYGPGLLVLFTAVLVLVAGPQVVRQISFEQTQAQIIQARHRLENGSLLEQLNQAYRDVAKVVEPSVVHVSATYIHRNPLGPDRMAYSTGSGWVYDDLGHVVTNHHVVKDAERIQVQFHDGYLKDATLLGSDPSTDVAVLKVADDRLHPAKLANVNESVNQGDLVFAFGSPFDHFRFSMSSGVVSGKGRSVGVIRDESGNTLEYENFIQVDAAINPGNSGGPLTNHRGEVIGMNTAIATGRRGTSSLEEGQFAGIGLAIPLEMIEPVVTQIIDQGFVEKGFLSVRIATLDPRDAQRIGFVGRGVVITWVDPRGPAGVAGVKPGDIVTHVNTQKVETTDQLRSMISSILPGQTVQLRVWRYNQMEMNGREIVIDVTLTRKNPLLGN